jgi:AraC-like DNA-binding protein
VLRTRAVREVIPQDPRFSTRWHQHDYPSPLARWNFHPEYEVHLVREGTGRYIVGDTIGRFEAGQLVLVGPDVPHDWISDLDPGQVLEGRDVVLQFHDQWVRRCQAAMPELVDLDVLLANSTRGIEFSGRTAEEGAEQLQAIGRESGTARVTRTLSLLDTLARAPEHEVHYLANEWVPTLSDPRVMDDVGRTLDYVFTHLTSDVRLSVAADMVGMSPSAFSRYFKEASGHTFSDMVRRLRLAHACKLLDTTSLPVTDVATASGYRNLSNFNRQFLSELGLTPREYRTRAT